MVQAKWYPTQQRQGQAITTGITVTTGTITGITELTITIGSLCCAN
jgi:hypothetical protein